MRVILAMGAICVLFAPAVLAQPNVGVTVDVPFAFLAGDVPYPAGSYMVERAGNGTSVRLKRVDSNGKAQFLVVVPISRPTKNADKSVAVFARYDSDHTYLKQIWNADRAAGWDLPPGRTERQFATPKFVAANQPEKLTILAEAK